jgi:hypothetical protein
MATGVYTDFVIYNDEFYSQFNETLTQYSNAFNQGSQNGIVLVTENTKGNAKKEAFFQSISSLVTRRNIASVSPQTPTKLTSDDRNHPKLSRKYYIENTLDSLRRIGVGEGEFSLAVGEQVAKAVMVDYLDIALGATVAALASETSGGPAGVGSFVDKSSSGANTLRISYLIEALAALGDANQQVVAWVMHSQPFFDLMGEQATNITDRLAGATIYEGTVGTLGKPVVVTDSASLIKSQGVSASVNSYYTIGLTAGGVMIEQDGQPRQVGRVNTGKENLTFEIQGEYDFTLGVKGFDYTDSTVNPADASITNSSNWNLVMQSVKNGAGVLLEHA